MGGSCNNCQHRCCINGESGIIIVTECEICGEYLQLCSNNLSEKQLEQRWNGEACGCGDRIDIYLCEKCKN